MCGIFGYIGARKADPNKLMLLGIMNEERGTDSCGIYINKGVYKGADTKKRFRDLIPDIPWQGESADNTVFGHTRNGTVGLKTLENAHPFVVDDELVLVHNGVIRNAWEITKARGITYQDYKVDSHGLALCIRRTGYDVLAEYEGYAALAFANRSEDNTLCLYHGASRDKKADEKPIEERPLFYFYVLEDGNRVGLYFSSIYPSLVLIGADMPNKSDIYNLPYNKVMKYGVREGVIKVIEATVIDREDVNIGLEKNKEAGNNYYPNQQNFQRGIPANVGVKNVSESVKPLNGASSSTKIYPYLNSLSSNEQIKLVVAKGRYKTTLKDKYLHGTFLVDLDMAQCFSTQHPRKDSAIKKITANFFCGVIMGHREYQLLCRWAHKNKVISGGWKNNARLLSHFSDFPVAYVDELDGPSAGMDGTFYYQGEEINKTLFGYPTSMLYVETGDDAKCLIGRTDVTDHLTKPAIDYMYEHGTFMEKDEAYYTKLNDFLEEYAKEPVARQLELLPPSVDDAMQGCCANTNVLDVTGQGVEVKQDNGEFEEGELTEEMRHELFGYPRNQTTFGNINGTRWDFWELVYETYEQYQQSITNEQHFIVDQYVRLCLQQDSREYKAAQDFTKEEVNEYLQKEFEDPLNKEMNLLEILQRSTLQEFDKFALELDAKAFSYAGREDDEDDFDETVSVVEVDADDTVDNRVACQIIAMAENLVELSPEVIKADFDMNTVEKDALLNVMGNLSTLGKSFITRKEKTLEPYYVKSWNRKFNSLT